MRDGAADAALDADGRMCARRTDRGRKRNKERGERERERIAFTENIYVYIEKERGNARGREIVYENYANDRVFFGSRYAPFFVYL